MKKISISHIDNRHSQWLRALDFYKQEIGILKDRLTEIAGKNTGDDVMKNVEHYENQFKVQADNIDRLKHDINENLRQAQNQLQGNKAGYVDGALFLKQEQLERSFSSEEHTVNELRHEFNRFSAEWM